MLELSELEVLASGLDHPECVIWDPRRQILFTGGEAGQVFSVGLDGTVVEVANTGGRPLGLALTPDGAILACDLGLGAVVRVDPERGSAEIYSLGLAGERIRLPNHVSVDADGTAYVTDSGRWGHDDGCVLRIAPGCAAEPWSIEPRGFPNGCVLTLDGRRLLVVESSRATVGAITIGADGEPAGFEVLARLRGIIPDGLALAGADSVLLGCFRPDRVYRTSLDGQRRMIFDDPWGMTIPTPTAAVLAGVDHEVLVVACHGDDRLVFAPSAGL